jgi:peroxiredoxin
MRPFQPSLLACAALGAGAALVLLSPVPVGPTAPAQEPEIDTGSDVRAGDLTGLDQVLKERTLALDRRDHPIGRRIPDLEFTDTDGKTGRLSDYADKRGLVIVTRDAFCPVSVRIGHKTARLEKEYRSKGIAFLYVDMSPTDSVGEMKLDIEKFDFQGRYAVDPEATFGKVLKALTTTDVFVLDAARTLVYRGAVDDQYGRGYKLPAPNREYLRDALENVIARTAVAVPATSAPGCFLELEIPEDDIEFEPGEVTWNDQVSRIVQQRCTPCHRDAGGGPFAFDTYEDVAHRKMVRFVVDKGIMPPWFAEDDNGPWLNDTRLSDWQRAAMLAWAADGYPVGDPEDAPVPVEFPSKWAIGKPDFIFTPDEISVIPAEGDGSYRPITCEATAPFDMWVRKMEVLPSVRQVVHHAMVMIQHPNAENAQYLNDLNKNLIPWSKNQSTWRFFAGYLPGMNPAVYPEGTAVFVPKGAKFLFYMHYNPYGAEALDQTQLGLVFAKGTPTYVASTEIWRKRGKWMVPAGAPKVVYEMNYEVDRDRILRSVTPHLHLRGKIYDATIIRPDGTVEPLLQIPEWDQDWQFIYTFLNDKIIRKGSTIRLVAEFDNSANNPNNPDPTVDVYNGPLTKDEMMMLGLEWIDLNPNPDRSSAQ